MKAQGFDLTKNAYNNRFQPYLAYWGCAWTLFFILINGYTVFFNFTASGFLTACMYIFLSTISLLLHDWLLNLALLDINIPIFVFLYVGWKVIKRTSIWKPLEMDFVTVSSKWIMMAATNFLLMTFFLFYTGHSYSRRNRITNHSTEEHLGAHCKHYFLSRDYVDTVSFLSF